MANLLLIVYAENYYQRLLDRPAQRHNRTSVVKFVSGMSKIKTHLDPFSIHDCNTNECDYCFHTISNWCLNLAH